MARALRAWAIKGRKKNSVHNSPYGPRTRLIRGIYSAKLAVREARICFKRKVLPSFTAAWARSSNRKQNFFRRLRHWWNFSTSLVELFVSEIFGNARFLLIFANFKLLWTEWVAYLYFSANFTLISEKWLWPLEYPFKPGSHEWDKHFCAYVCLGFVLVFISLVWTRLYCLQYISVIIDLSTLWSWY